MAKSNATAGLVGLEKCPVQPYFSNSIQLAGIIEWILGQTGPADVMISTFSTSEEFLRHLVRLRKSGKVRSCSLFCDLRAARKTASLYHFIRGVFDSVALCQNHSKIVLVFNDTFNVAVVTSQNQTRGDRYEAGIITTDSFTFYNLRLGFDSLAENSLPVDVLLKGND
ncbi:C4-dicarboxylate ABC transporter [uncultured Duncaniella sp.]|uniref:C4-dicarboxylate ABC transporter n=1 Tax=uncultured Duncaniella sp. TaxID=2768039 RepID=UPI0025FFEDE1|nr:C4-dicarboxylate ABC transporter [uncultured Duncaniella sp.]